MWGGQLEIRALAESLGVTIIVYSANSQPVRTVPSGLSSFVAQFIIRINLLFTLVQALLKDQNCTSATIVTSSRWENTTILVIENLLKLTVFCLF